MDQEFIQIGNYLISKAVFDGILPAASALLGTVFGGLLTYFTIRSSDKHKWEQEKQDRLSSERRKAIGLALEWISPFRDAITKAGLLTGSFLQNTIDPKELRSEWPYLLRHPKVKDPPARLQVWLRPDVYRRSLSIVVDLNNFLSEVSVMQTPSEQWRSHFARYLNFFTDLDERLNKLEDDLAAEYKRTFE